MKPCMDDRLDKVKENKAAFLVDTLFAAKGNTHELLRSRGKMCYDVKKNNCWKVD
jgi:hypothetical protein